MAKTPCHNCSFPYNLYLNSKCPKCKTPAPNPFAPDKHLAERGMNFTSAQNRIDEPPKSPREIAIQSARIVNGYGETSQIIGIILGIVLVLASVIIGAKISNVGVALAGIVFGILAILLFAVQGAIFRMISNYVIARLEP